MKRKSCKMISMLLAIFMLVSMMPTMVWGEEMQFTETPSVEEASLLPLEEVEARLDLTQYTKAQLANIKVADVMAELKDVNGEPIAIDTTAIKTVWSDFFDEYGNTVYDKWQVLSMEDTIDFSLVWKSSWTLQLIVGSGNQLDSANIRYIVRMTLPTNEEMYAFSAFVTEENVQKPIYTEMYEGSYNKHRLYYIDVPEFFTKDDSFSLKIGVNEDYADISIDVYEGFYESEEEIQNAVGKNPEIIVPAEGMEKTWLEKYTYDFSIVQKRNDEVIAIDRVYLRFSTLYTGTNGLTIDFSSKLPKEIKSVKASEILSKIDLWNAETSTARYAVEDSNEGWMIITEETELDLSESTLDYSYPMVIITGVENDRPFIEKYELNIIYPDLTDMFDFQLARQKDDKREAIETVGYVYNSNSGEYLYADVDLFEVYRNEKEFILSMQIDNSSCPEVEFFVYDGLFATEEAIQKELEKDPLIDITQKIQMPVTDENGGISWNASKSKGLTVLRKNGDVVSVEKMLVDLFYYDDIDYSRTIYCDYSYQLKQLKRNDLLQKMNIAYDEEELKKIQHVWLYDEGKDEWEELSEDDTCDFSERNMGYDGEHPKHYSVAVAYDNDTPDLETYSVLAKCDNLSNVFDISFYHQTEETRTKLDAQQRTSTKVEKDEKQKCYFEVGERWNMVVSPQYIDEKMYAVLNLTAPLEEGVTIDIYAGAYKSADEAVRRNKCITDQMVVEDATVVDCGYLNNWFEETAITIVYQKDEEILGSDTIYLHMEWYASIVESEGLSFRYQDENGETVIVNGNELYSQEKYYYDNESGVENLTYVMRPEFAADMDLELTFNLYDEQNYELKNENVTMVALGHYDSVEQAKKKEDIKEKLFRTEESTAEYFIDNFEKGVKFTVFVGKEVFRYTVYTENAPEPAPKAPELNGAADKYFRVNKLFNMIENEGATTEEKKLDTFIVPSNLDTYYINGYQTLLVCDEEADLEHVIPEVGLGYHANVYDNGVLEKTEDSDGGKLRANDFSKEEKISDTHPAHAVKYTVTAENHIHHKNYWVTVVKKTEEAKLFVNGPDEREIFLNNYFQNAHDIFIANVGAKPLTGLKVTLTNAKNVKLDEYWTVGGNGNDTLAAFESTEQTSDYGVLPNTAKIRLLTDGEGEISGTLTISADGQKTRKIKLTGTAGNPQIDTKLIPDAVKYVPYSTIVTTNNIHDWNTVTFRAANSADLPAGVKVLPSGEIYGVPRKAGKYKLTVVADYSIDAFDSSVVHLDLVVQENSDKNVKNSIDKGYEITKELPERISAKSKKDFPFELKGEFNEFMKLYIDGRLLTEGLDFEAEEGSTKITVYSQTIQSLKKGDHTIGVEYRMNGNQNDLMKKSAQNFTSGASSTSYGGTSKKTGNKGAVTASISTQPVVPETKPEEKTEEILPPTTADGFADIQKDAWYYADVEWAYNNGYMVGIDNTNFAPNTKVNYGMIAIVLSRIMNADVSAYSEVPVSGVQEGMWFTDYAKWARQNGIFTEGTFNPYVDISREDMAIALLQCLKLKNISTEIVNGSFAYADSISISTPEARDALMVLSEKKIFLGRDNNTIDPLSKTTRAEFAALANRLNRLLQQ